MEWNADLENSPFEGSKLRRGVFILGLGVDLPSVAYGPESAGLRDVELAGVALGCRTPDACLELGVLGFGTFHGSWRGILRVEREIKLNRKQVFLFLFSHFAIC